MPLALSSLGRNFENIKNICNLMITKSFNENIEIFSGEKSVRIEEINDPIFILS